MITVEDILAQFPDTSQIDRERIQAMVDVANQGFPDSRFGDNAATADRGRALYVMHMLTKPPVDLKAAAVRAQVATLGKPFVKKPHPWDATEHGKMLKGLVTH
jgi:hypothetical protein